MIKQAKTATMDDEGAESIIQSITEYYTVCMETLVGTGSMKVIQPKFNKNQMH